MDPATILVVEDESGMRNTLAANLEEQGYRTIACKSGKEARASIHQHYPNVVIADLRLPDASGLEILETLKEINPEAAFILITGYASLETAVEAVNEGAFAYITKPFNIEQVHSIIRNALKQQRLLLENRKLVENLQQTNKELSNEVAERRRAEVLLAERTVALEAANKELEAFSFSVSHDLRAPLRSIQGFSEALLEDCVDNLDSQGKDHLQRVCAASQRMAGLIDDLLSLSRITRSEMHREVVDLGALAKTIVLELHNTQPERRVEFVIAEGLVDSGDGRLLQVALENLLGNAWKYTGKHPRARIEFGVTEHNGKRAYFVRDDGAGFDMAYAEKLFAPFQRLHAATEFPGSGIGLATVERIIHRHGGRLWAEGALEQGATLYFTLWEG